MAFQAKAIDMVDSPNFFKESLWETTPGNSTRLYFQLQIVDAMGERRYIPASGATMKAEFQRARSLSAMNPVSQSIQKNAIAIPEDKSMFYIDLNTADTQAIISGTVRFTLVESGVTTVFVQNYFVTRKPVTAGN
jgi:hypothetical protein